MTGSIFISYSRKDRSFVRALVRDLTDAGVNVSFDDMERLEIGDRLTTRLKNAIDRHDYLGVVLSPDSVASEWVQRELAWAMEEENSTERVKVLPLIARPCKLPEFFDDRLQADLSSPAARRRSLLALIRRLGGDTFTATTKLFPLLGALASQATGSAISTATISATIAADVEPPILEPFMLELVPRASPDGLLGLAYLCIQLVDRADACHAAAEAAVANEDFPEYGYGTLSALSKTLTSDAAVEWWHDVFVEHIRIDDFYNTLIQQHGPLLLTDRYDRVAAYLLHPDRGPAHYNVDTMLSVIQATDRPEPFVTRWIDWIRAGRFDGGKGEGDEHPELLYDCLNDLMESRREAIAGILTETLDRVRYLLKSGDRAKQQTGMTHLLGMLDAEITFPALVRTEILERIYEPSDRTALLAQARPRFLRAFGLLERSQETGDGDTAREFRAAHRRVSELVRDGG